MNNLTVRNKYLCKYIRAENCSINQTGNVTKTCLTRRI